MKKILITICLTISLIACKKEAAIDYAIISGNIINIDNETLKMSSLNDSFSKKINLSKTGTFVDTLKLDEANFMLYDGKNVFYIYLKSGDNINVTYDFEDIKNTLKFTGIGSEINNYIVTKKNKEREIIGNNINVYELNETEFLAKQKEIQSNLEVLASSTQNLPKDYLEKEIRNLNYAYLSNIDYYEEYHRYYTQNPDFKVSEGFLKELENLNYNIEEDYKFSTSYSNLVISHFRKEAKKLSETSAIDEDVAHIKVLNTLTNEFIKNKLLYENAKYGITYTSNLEAYYNAFITGCTNEEHKKEITESYNILKSVSKGQPSPKFVNYENNAGGTTSLDDFKGKYVYIDVWATWCGPCKAEIPFLKEVEEKYHGKNIEFISISVDNAKDHDKWKKMIVDESLGGVQLMADKDFDSDFVKEYFIKGIPKFILVDPNGIIVDSNAPRPSDEALIKLFNELNI